MSTLNGAGWLLVSDKHGQPYWQRESDGVIATVQLTEMNGELIWRYSAGIDQWSIVGYKSTIRAAKVAATKALQWYKLRAGDFRRVKAKLRELWRQQGIESVEPMYGYSWSEKNKQWAEAGIIWNWDDDLTMWRSGAWRLWYNRSTGWMLRYPDDYIQELHVDNRYDAMREAAFWIGLALAQ